MNKIYALPFTLSPDRAPQVVELANYITEHKILGLFKLIKSMVMKTLPQVSDASRIQIRKAYLPIWYYDMAIRANVTRESDGQERELLGVGLNGFWTGHTWDPMCYLSFGFPLQVDSASLQPFSADTINNDDDIQVIPFTTDPFQDLEDHVATGALEGLSVGHGKQAVKLGQADMVFSAAYPLYFPVYIAKVDDDSDTVIVVGGQSDNPPVFKYKPEQRQRPWMNSGEWIRLDVTDPSWRVGLPVSPLQELCKLFVDKAVNDLVTNREPRRPIQWDDVRIQSYKDHQKENKGYIEQLYKVWAQQGMLTQLDHMDGDKKTLGMGKNGLELKSAEQFKQEILDSVGNDLKKLEALEPQWLKDYNYNKINNGGQQ
ncbi:hypothetical protein BC941DRAFT_353428 [Chlamydoabsidia padenii]|nr:hypothetical protein BC941DRAFT_353428 [Chlamydoabsidia padenii]